MRSRSIRAMLFAVVVLSISVLSMSSASSAQVRISVGFGPPALPVYEQPICPGDGYLWTPGYWGWADDDYYWVPGTWVEAPEVGYLWTPPYWGWEGGAYIFNAGYWGPHMGFYGGINYGFGYFGNGFEGGRWDGGHFFYNRSVTNINVTVIHNVYEKTVVRETTVNRVSYNGGQGGITARPTREDEEAARDRHIAPVAAQTQHSDEARGNKDLRASENHGKPPIAATDKPGNFRQGATPAKEAGGNYNPPANRGAATGTAKEGQPENGRPAPTVNHPNDLPKAERPAPPNTGNAKQDKKYQQQQDKLAQKQDQDRQKLQAQQDKEHQQMAKQNANQERQQQVEQKHQQQTQQLQQRHTQQQQQLQQRQAPAPRSEPAGRPRG
jgi:hypothetical protein